MPTPTQSELVGFLLSDSNISTARAMSKETLPDFPTNGCATFLSHILRNSEMIPVSNPIRISTGRVTGNGPGIVDDLLRLGWQKKTLLENPLPSPGDIFITTDDNENGKPDHVGFVLAPIGVNKVGNAFFWACDNSKPKYIRNVHRTAGGRTPVEYWLRKENQ